MSAYWMYDLETQADYAEPPVSEPAYPDGATPVAQAEPIACALCETEISGGSTAWVDPDGNVSHPACWNSELAEQSDPMRYYGMSSRDF